MRISLLALGSQGDVQPFIALARGLVSAGHDVQILAAGDYESLVQGYGIAFRPLVGRADDLMDRELVFSFFDGSGNPIRMASRFLEGVEPHILSLFQDCWAACRGTETIIASSLGVIVGHHVAEKLNVPCYVVHMHPNSRTHVFPHMFFPALPAWVPLRGHYNWLTHALGEQGLWQLLRLHLNRARREVLGLPVLSLGKCSSVAAANGSLALYAYSQRIAPKPPDWDARARITGYWFLPPPESWAPPQDLIAFLESGPPPVYVGFGSNLIGRHPEQVTAMIVEALQGAGVRGLLYSGWGDLADRPLPPGMMKIGQTPHAWLFPQMAAVVHHGGAGTTAAALRAGVPAVAVPFFGDQTFWARRVFELGAGPAPIPRKALNTEHLTAAIRAAVSDRAMQTRTSALGALLRAEDGVQQAVRLFTGDASDPIQH